MKRSGGLGLLLLLVLLCLPEVRAWMESRMSLHMALELPLLFFAGWLIGSVAPRRWPFLARVDASGLFSATTASCILALWMVPAALDMAVLDPAAALLKYGMWVLAGGVLQTARSRITPVIAAFFLANAGWMTASAGLLYLDAEQQLCVNYLVDDQRTTGFALIAWGMALGAWALNALRPLVVDTR